MEINIRILAGITAFTFTTAIDLVTRNVLLPWLGMQQRMFIAAFCVLVGTACFFWANKIQPLQKRKPLEYCVSVCLLAAIFCLAMILALAVIQYLKGESNLRAAMPSAITFSLLFAALYEARRTENE